MENLGTHLEAQLLAVIDGGGLEEGRRDRPRKSVIRRGDC
jgi:hypothetical protein